MIWYHDPLLIIIRGHSRSRIIGDIEASVMSRYRIRRGIIHDMYSISVLLCMYMYNDVYIIGFFNSMIL